MYYSFALAEPACQKVLLTLDVIRAGGRSKESLAPLLRASLPIDSCKMAGLRQYFKLFLDLDVLNEAVRTDWMDIHESRIGANYFIQDEKAIITIMNVSDMHEIM